MPELADAIENLFQSIKALGQKLELAGLESTEGMDAWNLMNSQLVIFRRNFQQHGLSRSNLQAFATKFKVEAAIEEANTYLKGSRIIIKDEANTLKTQSSLLLTHCRALAEQQEPETRPKQ